MDKGITHKNGITLVEELLGTLIYKNYIDNGTEL